MSYKFGTCAGCGNEGLLIKEVIGSSVDDWAMFCEECSSKPWFFDPMQCTLEEIFEYLDGSPNHPGNPFQDNAHASELLRFCFSQPHPVEVGQLFQMAMEGLDMGPTQGSYHPDLQNMLEGMRKDPTERFE